MTRPLVGITVRHEELNPKRTHHNIYPYDYQFTSYARRVAEAGGIPVWLPNVGGEVDPGLYVQRVDLLLLSGGEDVHPKEYGEEIASDTVQVRVDRDAFELPLIRAFWEAGKPILAVCRGLQVLNVALGGTLYQDLACFPNAGQHEMEGNEYTRSHTVRIIPGSRLANALGADELTVNTSHHQMIKDVAPGLRAVAWSAPDGIIEAAEGTDERPVVGVQWHPEMMDDDASKRLFAALLKS